MKKWISTILLAAWVAMILFLSFQNGSDTANTSMTFTAKILRLFTGSEPDYEMLVFWDGRFRLAAHFVLLFLYGLISFETVYQWTNRSRTKGLAISMVSGILIGIVAEVGKLPIEGRHCDLWEMMLNVIGAAIGSLVILGIRRLVEKRV
ncbi:MAG: VanZ family protein [Lachnospiraceae bacterium]|nr:VanZ family protein [Lachnospiraceae bacterium]